MNSTNTILEKQQQEQMHVEKYLLSLNEKELKAYHIAREHLGMSFSLEKSIGYLNWKKDNITTLKT